MKAMINPKVWPEEGVSRAPYWIYTDPDIYAREQENIFRGKSWHYVGLEAEVPQPGNYKTTYIGETSVVLTRTEDGEVHALINRCAHRGNMVCREAFGSAKRLYCVYHAWSYQLNGDLSHAAFSQGLNGQGGLPKDFDSWLRYTTYSFEFEKLSRKTKRFISCQYIAYLLWNLWSLKTNPRVRYGTRQNGTKCLLLYKGGY